MYGLSVISSMQSLKTHEAAPPSSPPRADAATRPGRRVLAIKAAAIAALFLALPLLDTLV
jgi:hypothetical protein